jgi:hypothetical protein
MVRAQVPCYDEAVRLSGCASDDFACQCGPASQTTVVQDHLTTCLSSSCTYADISNYQTWAIDTCVNINLASMSASLSSMTIQYLATTTPNSGLSTTRRNNPTTTVTTRPTAAASNKPQSKTVSIGIIIGAVIGGILVLGFLCMAVIFCLWRRSKSKAKARAQQPLQQHQVQPLIPHQSQIQQAPVQYQVPPMQQRPQVLVTAQVLPASSNTTLVSDTRHNTPAASGNTIEMEGEGRKSFVEIGGTETVIRGGANRPAELGSELNRGQLNRQ